MTVIFVGFEVVGALGPRTPILLPATGPDFPVPARLRRCGAGKGNFNGFWFQTFQIFFLLVLQIEFFSVSAEGALRGGQVGDFDGCMRVDGLRGVGG